MVKSIESKTEPENLNDLKENEHPQQRSQIDTVPEVWAWRSRVQISPLRPLVREEFSFRRVRRRAAGGIRQARTGSP